jgi:hypothetical protein
VREAARRKLPVRLVDKPKLGFPLYGHQYLRLSKGFFRGGFLDEALGVSEQAEEYMLSSCPPYFVAKLASIEAFGRLFGLSQTQGQVTEHMHRFTSVREEASRDG